jgi:hypothetical protein
LRGRRERGNEDDLEEGGREAARRMDRNEGGVAGREVVRRMTEREEGEPSIPLSLLLTAPLSPSSQSSSLLLILYPSP